MNWERFKATIEESKGKVKKCGGCDSDVPVPSEDQAYRRTGGKKCENCEYEGFPDVVGVGAKPIR